MPSRRIFLKNALLTTLACRSASALTAETGVSKSQQPPIHAVVYDRRFSESVEFGLEAEGLGQPTRAINGDVTSLWYNDLYHRWRKGPATVCGLTTRDAFFCIETLGRDAGMDRLFTVEHRIDGLQVEHCLHGPHGWVQGHLLDFAGHRQWPRRMAHVLRELSGYTATSRALTSAAIIEHSGRWHEPRLLVSWLLAPSNRPRYMT